MKLHLGKETITLMSASEQTLVVGGEAGQPTVIANTTDCNISSALFTRQPTCMISSVMPTRRTNCAIQEAVKTAVL